MVNVHLLQHVDETGDGSKLAKCGGYGGETG
jgi:hypothetical protein